MLCPRCIDERVVLNMTDGSYRLPFKARNDIHGVGYRIQMALKLFGAEHITTDFYLTMDSDIRLTRPLWNSSYFLPENKAYINWQRRSVHPNYFSASEAVLKAKGCLDPRLESWVVGVTPEVLHRLPSKCLYSFLFHS